MSIKGFLKKHEETWQCWQWEIKTSCVHSWKCPLSPPYPLYGEWPKDSLLENGKLNVSLRINTFSFSLLRSLSLEDWSKLILGLSPMRSWTLSFRLVSDSCTNCWDCFSTASGPRCISTGMCTVQMEASSIFKFSVSLAFLCVSLSLGECFWLWCHLRFWL